MATADRIKDFIECTSLSISYDIMGIATVSYILISNDPEPHAWVPLTVANRTFEGYVSNIDMNPITDVVGYYEHHITLITTTTT